MASADFSRRLPASPFQVRGEISPDKSTGLHHTTAGSTTSTLDHESFAVICPLALIDIASYPISVRRPVIAFPASFSLDLAVETLRFPWFSVTRSPEDLHLQVSARDGRTN